MNAKQNQQPLIGIWWDNGEKIVAFHHPPNQPEADNGLCDSSYFHNDFWPEAAMQFGLEEFAEYNSIPRGRVRWSPSKKTSFIYHGNATSRQRLEKIAEIFELDIWEAQRDGCYMMRTASDTAFDD